jgi:hypothetical protein
LPQKYKKMRLQKYLWLIIFALVAKSSAQSQDPQAERDYLFRSQWALGGGFHVQGFEFSAQYLKKSSARNGFMVDMDFGVVFDYKEINQKRVSSYYARSFIYGKKNFMFQHRLGVHGNTILFEKYREKGVEIAFRYGGGFSVAYLQPIFLKVIDANATTISPADIQIERYDENKHTISQILGRASIFEGIPYTKAVPGVYARTGMSFDWFKKRKDFVGLVEIGATVDVYFQQIEIMAFQPKQYVFWGAYIKVMLGQKIL